MLRFCCWGEPSISTTTNVVPAKAGTHAEFATKALAAMPGNARHDGFTVADWRPFRLYFSPRLLSALAMKPV
jgi:hypothetical protein